MPSTKKLYSYACIMFILFTFFITRLEGSGVFIALATVCVRLLEVHLLVYYDVYTTDLSNV